MLDFECRRCHFSIVVDFENIGDVVQCPNCESAEIVPDITFPSDYEYGGYSIMHKIRENHLWIVYRAKNIANPEMEVFLKVPSTFFLKHISDLNAFIDTVIRNGSLNVPEFPALLDRSIVMDEMYFAYDFRKSTHEISYFAKIDYMDSLHIIRNIAISLKDAWNKNYLVHQDLTPDNILLTKEKEVRILNMGISDSLLKDRELLEWGFNIWDRRYMSPEFITEGIADSPLCDIYSLGGILFLMITGHHPFERVNPIDIHKVPIPDPLQYNTRIPPKIVALYQMMMAKDMNTRINSWEVVIDNLNSLMGLNVKSAAQTQFVQRYEKTETKKEEVIQQQQREDRKRKKVFHLHKEKEKEKPKPHLKFNSDSAKMSLTKVHNKKWKTRK